MWTVGFTLSVQYFLPPITIIILNLSAIPIIITDKVLLVTSLNPQNLRNIIKKVAKISIIQLLMSNLSVKTTVFCYFLQLFSFYISHKFCTFTLVVDKILTNYIMIENTLLFHIRNQCPKVNKKSEYRKIYSISILTNWLINQLGYLNYLIFAYL